MKAAEYRTLAPAAGKCIPDPDEGFKRLPPEGKRVRMSTYWVQLLADESVSDVTAPTDTPKPATKASKADS
jgi:hypothetical protein